MSFVDISESHSLSEVAVFLTADQMAISGCELKRGAINMHEPLVYPVVSNEYEVAINIIRKMLQNGLISKKEYDKINAENIRTFIGK